MAMSPQPPRPPEPPPPPRSNSSIIAIALLVLALIVVVGGLVIYTGLELISRSVKVQVDQSAGGKKEVSINTPLGSLQVHHDVDVERIGLPVYPGATRLRDKDSATVKFKIAGEQNVSVLAAKFETSDPIDKVRDYYHAQLGAQVTRYTERDREGKTVFEIKRPEQTKVVALKREFDGTRIELVRVIHARDEGN
jgi:hypothetical protein